MLSPLRALWLILPLCCAFGAPACGSEDHPPPFSAAGRGGSAPIDGGLDIETGAGGDPNVCGQDVIPAVSNPPNLYFVIDRSGSMNEPFGDASRYETTRDALEQVLQQIGHRVHYGAAVFPALAYSDGCGPGVQVFPSTQGDPARYARDRETGPILAELLSRLGYAGQEGGTPTAETLAALRPTLVDLGPRTYVVLATDGAPNCNADTSCEASRCMLNVEGFTVDGNECTPDYNCCDPDNTAVGAERWCVDGARLEEEVEALAESGIPTYVIGMPGASYYADLLNRLAELGGTAREGETAYYAADDPAVLIGDLLEIGTGLAISCTVELEHEPEDPGQVNLYFDERLLPSDDDDGWRWAGPQTVEIVGAACDELGSGEVIELQIRYGCATVVR
jgi:hypothetical protein